MGMISTSLWVGMGVCLIAVFVLILVNRSHYTNVLRNKRYWNKQIFEGKYGKIPIPLCPETVDSIYTGVNSLEQDVRSGISSGLIDAAKSVESGSKWVTAHAQEYAAQAAPATTQNAANTASK
jgi:hypothetical protein